MPSEEHIGIYVTPDFVEIGHDADLAIEIGDLRNRQVGANCRRALFTRRSERVRRDFFERQRHHEVFRLQLALALRGIA